MLDSDSVSVLMKGCDVMSGENIDSRFNEIYDTTNKIILAFITAKCGNAADINDIFQETYMELYQRLQKRGADYVKDGKNFTLKIAKNKIARHYTLAERLKIFVSTTIKSEDNTEYQTNYYEDKETNKDLFLAEDNIENYIINQDILENVRQFIKQKPADVEKIFYFFYELDLSISEIAQILSITESNVKHKLYRTLKELRDLLNERWKS